LSQRILRESPNCKKGKQKEFRGSGKHGCSYGTTKNGLKNLSNISHMPTKFDAGTISSQPQLFKNTTVVFLFESVRAVF
jgi:hypothetical protein